MRVLRPISDEEMIAVFLRAEVDSDRWREKLQALLDRDGRDLDVLRRPDLADADENRYRSRVLEEHRGYERREGLFLYFPEQVDWFRAFLGRDEVLDILFIDWDWWLTLSGGTRRPRDAARRIREGAVAGVTAEEHEPIAAALRAGDQPELIAVTTPEHSQLVLLEGHVRLTAYALLPDCLPDELEAIVGVSDEMERWCQF